MMGRVKTKFVVVVIAGRRGDGYKLRTTWTTWTTWYKEIEPS